MPLVEPINQTPSSSSFSQRNTVRANSDEIKQKLETVERERERNFPNDLGSFLVREISLIASGNEQVICTARLQRTVSGDRSSFRTIGSVGVVEVSQRHDEVSSCIIPLSELLNIMRYSGVVIHCSLRVLRHLPRSNRISKGSGAKLHLSLSERRERGRERERSR